MYPFSSKIWNNFRKHMGMIVPMNSELYQKNKYYYNTKALIITFVPSYLLYYNIYENSIRRHSFVYQFLAIYFVYKTSLRFLLELDIDKNDENSYITNK